MANGWPRGATRYWKNKAQKRPSIQARLGVCVALEVVDMISVIITLVVVGLVLYLINTYVPMAQPIKNILMVVVVLLLCLWLLSVFGIISMPMRLN